MKRQLLTITILFLLALLICTAPAVAAQKETIGAQISLSDEDKTFPANAPFYIMHGWYVFPAEGPVASYGFELDVDGQSQGFDFFVHTGYRDWPVIGRFWVYNFPDGMTGTHTFTGRFILPCKVAEEYGGGPCETPYEEVEWETSEITVTFQ